MRKFIKTFLIGLLIFIQAFTASAWSLSDIFSSEIKLGGGSGTITPLPIKSFTGLNDTPNSYLGQANKVVTVNASSTGLIFTDFLQNLSKINFNTSYTPTGTEATGTIFWDSANHTYSGTLENGVIGQFFQELHTYGKNTSGVPILNGQAVSTTNVGGSFTTFALTDVTSATSAKAFAGIATQNIGVNEFGYITTFGLVRDIDTDSWTEGADLYVDCTSAGDLTTALPSADCYVIRVGNVEYKHANHGRINVRATVYPAMQDLSLVNGTPLTTEGQIPNWKGNYFDFDKNINDYVSYVPTDNTKLTLGKPVGVDSMTGSLTITPDYNGDIPNWGGDTTAFRIYGYKDIGGTRYYSSNYISASFTDDGTSGDYYLDLSWTAGDFDGYRIVLYDDWWYGYSYDNGYYDVSTNSFHFTISSFDYFYQGDLVVVTPSTAYSDVLEVDGNAQVNNNLFARRVIINEYTEPQYNEVFRVNTHTGGDFWIKSFYQGDTTMGTSRVDGGLRIGMIDVTNDTTIGGRVQFFPDSHPLFPGQVYFDAGTASSNAFIFRANANDEKMRIDNSGTKFIANVWKVDNIKDYKGTGKDVYDTYTGTYWDFYVALATSAIRFNQGQVNTDFQVFGDNRQTFHLDAQGGTSYIKANTDSTKAFQLQTSAGTAYFNFDSTNGKTQFGTGSNYTEFEADGTMKMNGTATVFDDLTSDLTRAKTIGTRVTFNDTNNSMDFTTLADTTDYVILTYQLSHKWKAGSTIYPHIHWEQAENNTPNFLIQYRWQKQGSAKTTSWTNYKTTTNAFTYTSGTLNQISHDSGITPPAGYGMSDLIQLRVIRDNANSSGVFSGADAYTTTVSVTSVDIHYEMDMLGSRQEYIK